MDRLNLDGREIEGIVFDLDGVLADTEPFHVEQWKLTLARHGARLPEGWFNGLMGYPDVMTARLLAEEHRIERGWRTVLEEKRNAVTEGAERIDLSYPGTSEGLERLNGMPKAVATSSCRQVAEAILAGSGLRGYFTAVVSADDVERTKPDPECYLTACRRLRLQPERCAAVEDSPAGIEAAGKAGLYVIAVCTSYPRRELTAADVVFETTKDAISDLAGRFTAA